MHLNTFTVVNSAKCFSGRLLWKQEQHWSFCCVWLVVKASTFSRWSFSLGCCRSGVKKMLCASSPALSREETGGKGEMKGNKLQCVSCSCIFHTPAAQWRLRKGFCFVAVAVLQICNSNTVCWRSPPAPWHQGSDQILAAATAAAEGGVWGWGWRTVMFAGRQYQHPYFYSSGASRVRWYFCI